MNTIQEQAFSSESSFISCCDAQLTSSAYDIEINQLNLPTAGRGIYYSASHCFLEYVMIPEHNLSARYPQVNTQQSIGQLIFIPPGVELEWHWESGSQQTITCMFDVQRLGLLSALDWNWRDVDLSQTFNIRNDYLLNGMRKLGEEARSPGFASELQIESMLSVMAIELHRLFIDKTPTRIIDQCNLSTTQLNQIRDYIYSHITQAISIQAIAKANHLSARELSEQFKQTTGLTLRQFIATVRIELAKKLLTNRNLMIKQVGYECGFKGAAAFVAAFRKTTGLTPVQYREHYLNSI